MMHIRHITILGTLIVALALSNAYAQTANLVLTVDGSVAIGSISNFCLVLKMKDGGERKVEAGYVPGDLSFDKEKLKLNEVDSLFLSFDYNEHSRKRHTIYNYLIPFNRDWLNVSYVVLHIYNLDKKEYRKIFDPIDGEDYTYEVDYPGGALKRIRKR